MAQGRNGEVYAVQEYLKDWIDGKDSTEIVELLQGAVNDLETTAEGYEDGSNNIQEYFGNTFQTDDMDQKAETIREGIEQIETLKTKIEEMSCYWWEDKKQFKYKQEIKQELDGVIDQLAI